jgi:hypothetical protein
MEALAAGIGGRLKDGPARPPALVDAVMSASPCLPNHPEPILCALSNRKIVPRRLLERRPRMEEGRRGEAKEEEFSLVFFSPPPCESPCF